MLLAIALAPIDWLVIVGYAVFAIAVGVVFSRRAGSSPEEFFLSGRSLPWWITGTSMVATTFAADTPLVVSGWVRDAGIWQNWLWWCFAVGGMLTVFIFARYWRRGEVMTTAELSELRYGGQGARVLRGFLGFYHSALTNTIVLCWVLLAAAKILDVLFGIDKGWALAIGCLLALSYSLLAGFWGVVITDLVQFTMAMVGAVCFAVIAWNAVGGLPEIEASVAALGERGENLLRMLPAPGEGGPGHAAFWTAPVAALAVYLGVSWWATAGVDGGPVVVQRIAATRSPRDGLFAVLWYNVANYALRPWPWIMVALASLVVLPNVSIEAPVTGRVVAIELPDVPTEENGGTITIETVEGTRSEVPLAAFAPWGASRPEPTAELGAEVETGTVLVRTDSERAYVVMMVRYLPAGLLGLVAASLLAAFMSTIDTHVNLAASFFVNDIYRRFVAPDRSDRHYVWVARIASTGVLVLGALLAWQSESIGDLFTFFLAFLSGVGPIYVLRWLWWRVTALTEIVAMVASSVATVLLTFLPIEWTLGPLSDGGDLSAEGRLLLVVAFSGTCSLVSLLARPAPEPASLVRFYERVRPIGAWAPVRRLAATGPAPGEGTAAVLGVASGLALTYSLLFGIGFAILGRTASLRIAAIIAVVATVGVVIACRKLAEGRSEA